MKKFLITIGIISFILVGLYLVPSVKTNYEVPTRSELLRLTNIEREQVGVALLIEDTRLDQSAQIKADDMVKNNYFNHVDNTGKHGYEYIDETAPGLCSIKSENITDNIYENNSKTAVNAFINSPKHYQAMINKIYTLVGFGISGTKIVEHFCQVVI